MEKKKIKISPLPIKKSVLKTITSNDFGAVLEDIRDKFTVIVEGLNMVTNRVDRLETKVDNLETTVNSKFQTVFEYLSRIDDDLKEIKKEISRLKKEKAEQEYAKSIEGRVLKLQLELLAIRNELDRKKA